MHLFKAKLRRLISGILFASTLFGLLPPPVFADGIISVGSGPFDSTAVGTKLYVSNGNAHTVSVVDTVTNTVLTDIPMNFGPQKGVLVGTKLYVNEFFNNTVSVIDTVTDTVTVTIPVGLGPMIVKAVGTKVYTADSNSNTVTVIDTATDTVSATIPVGSYPMRLTITGSKIYVTNQGADSLSVIDTVTDAVTATIPVGLTPYDGAMVGTNYYLVSYNTNSINVVDTITDTVTAVIPVGSQPFTATAAGTKVYVNNTGSSDVTVIDTLTNSVIKTISVGTYPYSSVHIGNNLYVINQYSSTISLINVLTDTLATTYDMSAAGTSPSYGTVIGDNFYVALGGGDSLYYLDTRSRLFAQSVNGSAMDLSFTDFLDAGSVPSIGDFSATINGSPVSITNVSVSGSHVLLTMSSAATYFDAVVLTYVPGVNPIQDPTGHDVDAFASIGLTNDTPTCADIAVGANPQLPTRAGTDIYVHNGSDNTVSVIDSLTDSVVATTTVGTQPFASTLVGTKLYVNNAASNDVSVIDTATRSVIATIPVGTSPRMSTAVGALLYVNNQNSSNVSVIDTVTDTVIDTVSVGTNPFTSTLAGTNLYVFNQTSDDVTVLDTLTNTVIATIPVGQTPIFGALIGTKLYVPAQSSNNVTVINTLTNAVITTIPVGDLPFGANVIGTKLYVVNTNSNDVSVIDSLTDTVIATISVGNTPRLATVVGKNLFVANLASDSVTVINTLTNTVTDTVSVGSSPLAGARTGAKLYMANLNSNDVTVIDVVTKTHYVCGDTHTVPVQYAAGPNGSITGSSTQLIAFDDNATAVTAVPNPGYAFIGWSDASTTNPRIDFNAMEPISVVAQFNLLPVAPGASYGGGSAVYGCTDPKAINYNKYATVLSTVRDCQYAMSIVPAPEAPKPVCVVALSPKSDIRFGGKNNAEDVRLLEQFLNKTEGAKLPVDGVYSATDRAAVIKWQEKYATDILKPWGLSKGTGQISTTSLKKINQLQQSSCSVKKAVAQNTSASCFAYTGVFSNGSNGTGVLKLQQSLTMLGYFPKNVAANGNYGPTTAKAVTAFQKANGIRLTGQVGPLTGAKLTALTCK